MKLIKPYVETDLAAATNLYTYILLVLYKLYTRLIGYKLRIDVAEINGWDRHKQVIMTRVETRSSWL